MLSVDDQTARVYGEIRVELKSRSSGMPENDLWIAAVVLQHGLMLVTSDAHFSQVPGLITEQV